MCLLKFKFIGEKCTGGKLSKERIILILAANMSGTFKKKKLLVIGKSKRPRCFKNVRSLPFSHYSNRRAWMTSEIFIISWVCDWDAELKKHEKKIIDICPAHPIISYLTSFLPNTTSILQTMDHNPSY